MKEQPYLSLKTELVCRVQSATTQGVCYEVKKTGNGSLICSCPGFLYRASCWHVQEVTAFLEENSEKDPESLVEMFEKLFPAGD